MKHNLITLTPLEPYFFGGERVFAYGEHTSKLAGGYFIKSLDTPSQTALFGALRYLGIVKKNADYALDKEGKDKKNIGEASFNMLKPGQEFGRINGISPLYLMDDKGDLYIRTPFDHSSGSEEQTYQPYRDYSPCLSTAGCGTDTEECRMLPKDYQGKKGMFSGWLRQDGKQLIKDKDIFMPVVRPHVDKSRQEAEGFVKRQYTRLEAGWRFAFFACVADDFNFGRERVIYLGQKKSAFAVQIDDKTEPSPEEITKLLAHERRPGQRFLYLQSDTFWGAEADIACLYNCCSFAMTAVKEHRVFTTNYEKGGNHFQRYNKGESVLKLLRAGGIFWTDKPEDVKKMIENEHFTHLKKAGFNRVVIGGEK